MENIERDVDRAMDKAEHAERKARNGFGTGLAGVITGGIALLSEWSRGGGISGLLGGNGSAGNPQNVNINTNGGGGNPSTFDVYSHECQDILNLTNEMWSLKVNTMSQAAGAREVDVNEKFGLYKSQVDGDFANYKAIRDLYDNTQDKLNNATFSLYKGQRDLYDTMNDKFCALAQKVAMIEAVQPYQNRLIQCEIDRSHTDSINYTDRKTCRMITGQVVLPSTPAVTGYGSYCCGSNNTAA